MAHRRPRRPTRRALPQLPPQHTHTVDQLWAGIEADTLCQCFHEAHEHVVTTKRTRVSLIRCMADCPCTTFVELARRNFSVIEGGKQ